MIIHKLAGIDIGSNSVRLLVANVMEYQDQTLFKKSSLTRLPIRLGTEAFGAGRIGTATQEKLIQGMEAYQRIMQVHGVKHYRACATSALREAKNGREICQMIEEQTGIAIERISGEEEARIIFSKELIGKLHEEAESFLYIDVGGGSTELTLFHLGQVLASRSFPVGTIRLLNEQVDAGQWEDMQQWILSETSELQDLLMVGSGGNINRAFKLSERKKGQMLSVELLRKMQVDLNRCSPDERIMRYDLNPDRADVITHALRIYTSAMKWSGARKMIVPKKGLADGIVRTLYQDQVGGGRP